MTTTGLINTITPEHERTSCSDDKLNNKGMDSDHGTIWCSRCFLLGLVEGEKMPEDAYVFLAGGINK